MPRLRYVGTGLQLAVLAAAVGLAGCGRAQDTAGPQLPGELARVPAEYVGKVNPLGPEATTAGASLFQTNCQMCHGAEGHGDGPVGTSLVPPPKNLAELSKLAADDYLFWRISTGKPGTSMMPWKGALTDEEIWQIIAYVRTLR